MVGLRFHKLVVIKLAPRRNSDEGRRWWCQCDCGKMKDVQQGSLRNGSTTTCGGKGCKKTSKPTHGASKTKLYEIWAGMRQRCSNPGATNYARYGGAGVRVCKRWADFASFAADMGQRPSAGHTLDRIDSNKGYTPSNVRWALIGQQQSNLKSNKVITYKGTTLHLSAWARKAGMNSATLSHRLLLGVPFERAIQAGNIRTRGPRPERLLTYKGKTQNLSAWAKEVGVTSGTIGRRLRLGATLQQVLSPTRRCGQPLVSKT